MADPGWVGAYGVQGGYEALARLIAERKKDELLREQAVERDRQFALDQWKAVTAAEESRRTNERLIRQEEEARAERQQTNLEQAAERITENTPIGAQLTLPQIATLQRTQQGGLVTGTPITQAPGLIEAAPTLEALMARRAGTPTAATAGPVTGGELVYGGTYKQQQDQVKAELDEARYQASIARDEASRRHAEEMERLAREREKRLDEQFRLTLAQRGGDEDTVTIRTVDEQGNDVTQVVRKSEALTHGPYTAARTADVRNREAARMRAGTTIQAIGELSERINTSQGLLAKVTGTVAKAQAQANLNDDIAEYEAIVQSFTPLVARAMGHTGVLTQQDVESTREIFPKPTDPKSLRDRKTKRLLSLVGTAGTDESRLSGGQFDETLNAFGFKP